MRVCIVSLAAFAFLMQSCQFDPYTDFYTTAKPVREDLVGRYRLTSQTVTADGLSAFEERPCEVELRNDGSFTATNVPEWKHDSAGDDFFAQLRGDSGTWSVDSVGSIANGDQPPKTHWGIILDSKSEERAPFGLTGSKPPFGLIFTVGDPDSGRALFFEKIEARTPDDSPPPNSDR
jgi:hypothetical protein